MGITVLGAGARTGFTPNTVFLILNRHHFAFNFFLFFVFDEFTVFVQGTQEQDISSTGFEASTTPNTFGLIDCRDKLGDPMLVSKSEASHGSHRVLSEDCRWVTEWGDRMVRNPNSSTAAAGSLRDSEELRAVIVMRNQGLHSNRLRDCGRC